MRSCNSPVDGSPAGKVRGDDQKSCQPPARWWRPIWLGCAGLFLVFDPAMVLAQFRSSPVAPLLEEEHFKDGQSTRQVFAPVVTAVRGSVVSFELDGQRVALGTIVAADGLILTKASEITGGELTARLPDGALVEAVILAVAEESDVALVRVQAKGLKPVEWSVGDPGVGQWVVTAGQAFLPEAVGIISVPPRRILHRRALIGVQLDLPGGEGARITRVMDGYGAAAAGIRPEDLILAVNATPVSSGEDLMQRLREFRAGQTVTLRVQREDEEFDVDVAMLDAEPGGSPSRLSRQGRLNPLGGQVSARAEGFAQALQHDTVLEPWQCGGPLVDLDGRAIGLNIARAGRIASYALPAGLAQEILQWLMVEAGLEPIVSP